MSKTARTPVPGSSTVQKLAQSELTTDYGTFTVAVLHTGLEQVVALYKGVLHGHRDVFCRIHSKCITAHDLFGNNCDCREQMQSAQEALSQEERGIILLLDQDGRGNGAAAHVATIELKKRNMSQSEAYEAIGFPADNRQFFGAATVLQHLGVQSVVLKTSNRAKIQALERFGIAVRQRNYTGDVLIVRPNMALENVAPDDGVPIDKGPRLFVYGDLNVDQVLPPPASTAGVQVLRDDEMGGTAYNAASAFAAHPKLPRPIIIGAIGADADGTFVANRLRKQRLTAILFQRSDRRTGRASILYYSSPGSRMIYQTSDSDNANRACSANNIASALHFADAGRQDLVFAAGHFLQLPVAEAKGIAKSLRTGRTRVIVDLIPHDINRHVTLADVRTILGTAVWMLVAEVRTLCALAGVAYREADFSDSQPSVGRERTIEAACRSLPADHFVLRWGAGQIGAQALYRRVNRRLEAVGTASETGYTQLPPMERRGFGDRLLAELLLAVL